MVRIRITAPGIYGTGGPVPVGQEIDVSEVPRGWKNYCVVISDSKGKTPVPDKAAEPTKAAKSDSPSKGKKTSEEKNDGNASFGTGSKPWLDTEQTKA